MTARVLCIPVLRRAGGFLLALPEGSVPPTLLEGGLLDPPAGIIGPSTTLLVPGAEESEEGIDVPVEEDLQVLVVDYDNAALQFLSPYDPGSAEPVVCFLPASPSVFPDGAILLARVRAWLQTVAGDRAAFYSAAEDPEHLPEEAAQPQGVPEDAPPKAKAKPKRVTTAQLADQLGSLLTLVPALTAQVQELTSRQQSLEGRLDSTPPAQVPTHILLFSQAPKANPCRASRPLQQW